MKKAILLILAGLILLMITVGCVSFKTATNPAEEFVKAEYIKLTPEEAKEMMETEDVIIIDVRTEEEFRQKHIERAILIPDYDLDKLAAKMLPDKDATILLYCRSGNRSERASHLLIGMGYQNIYDFGGIIDWHYGEVQCDLAN